MKTKRIVSSLLIFVMSLGILSTLSSCSGHINAKELSKGYTRQTTETADSNTEFESVMSDFSVSLLKKIIAESKGNDIISPISAIECLSMIANGTNRSSRTQIEDALGISIDELNKLIYKFNSEIINTTSDNVKVANSVWINKNRQFKIKESFLQTNADWYNAQIYETDFKNSKTIKDINNWVKNNTDKMIDKIIEEIPYDTFMYLINALAFDAKWEKKYEKNDIQTHPFTSYNGSTTDVELMFSTESAYLESENAKGFKKNYEGGKYSFVGILPNEGIDIFDYINSLDGAQLSAMLDPVQYENVYVGIPEFDFEYEIKLNDFFKEMGISNIFDKNADFSSMAEPSDGIYCDYIEQKVKIEVNRKGTKAAAVTWGSIKNESASEPEQNTVILNRPFMYMILDSQNNIPLFIGIVTNFNLNN